MPLDYLVIVPDDEKEGKAQKQDTQDSEDFWIDGANTPQPPVSAKEAKIASRRKRVKKLLEDGLNFREIAATLGHKPQTISSDVRAIGQEIKGMMTPDALFYIMMAHYEMKRKELVHLINNSRSASQVIRSVKLMDEIDCGYYDTLFRLGILQPAQDKEINVHMFCDEAHLAELAAKAKPKAMNESAPSSDVGNSSDSGASQASVSEPEKSPAEPSYPA